MVDFYMLQNKISESGMTMTAIAEKSGILKATLYNRLKGVGCFTVSEAVALQDTLHLSDREMKQIFLTKG